MDILEFLLKNFSPVQLLIGLVIVFGIYRQFNNQEKDLLENITDKEKHLKKEITDLNNKIIRLDEKSSGHDLEFKKLYKILENINSKLDDLIMNIITKK